MTPPPDSQPSRSSIPATISAPSNDSANQTASTCATELRRQDMHRGHKAAQATDLLNSFVLEQLCTAVKETQMAINDIRKTQLQSTWPGSLSVAYDSAIANPRRHDVAITGPSEADIDLVPRTGRSTSPNNRDTLSAKMQDFEAAVHGQHHQHQHNHHRNHHLYHQQRQQQQNRTPFTNLASNGSYQSSLPPPMQTAHPDKGSVLVPAPDYLDKAIRDTDICFDPTKFDFDKDLVPVHQMDDGTLLFDCDAGPHGAGDHRHSRSPSFGTGMASVPTGPPGCGADGSSRRTAVVPASTAIKTRGRNKVHFWDEHGIERSGYPVVVKQVYAEEDLLAASRATSNRASSWVSDPNTRMFDSQNASDNRESVDSGEQFHNLDEAERNINAMILQLRADAADAFFEANYIPLESRPPRPMQATSKRKHGLVEHSVSSANTGTSTTAVFGDSREPENETALHQTLTLSSAAEIPAPARTKRQRTGRRKSNRKKTGLSKQDTQPLGSKTVTKRRKKVKGAVAVALTSTLTSTSTRRSNRLATTHKA